MKIRAFVVQGSLHLPLEEGKMRSKLEIHGALRDIGPSWMLRQQCGAIDQAVLFWRPTQQLRLASSWAMLECFINGRIFRNSGNTYLGPRRSTPNSKVDPPLDAGRDVSLDFCIISRSSLGFGVKFQPALSSTRSSSCTSSQSSPSNNIATRTTLAWSVNKAHTLSCNTLRYYTSNAITLRCTISNQCIRSCSTLNLKIVSSMQTTYGYSSTPKALAHKGHWR